MKSEYSLLKDKSLQDITALKEELHVAKVLTAFYISFSHSHSLSLRKISFFPFLLAGAGRIALRQRRRIQHRPHG